MEFDDYVASSTRDKHFSTLEDSALSRCFSNDTANSKPSPRCLSLGLRCVPPKPLSLHPVSIVSRCIALPMQFLSTCSHAFHCPDYLLEVQCSAVALSDALAFLAFLPKQQGCKRVGKRGFLVCFNCSSLSDALAFSDSEGEALEKHQSLAL